MTEIVLVCKTKNGNFPFIKIITWGQFGLQDGNSPIMEELIFLHDFNNLVLIFIISFVGFIIFSIIKNSLINKNLLEMQLVERI